MSKYMKNQSRKKGENSKLKTEPSSFRPVNDIEKQSNFKRYFRIERDGTIIEKVLLDLPTKEKREEIILMHFLKFLTRNFQKKAASYKLLKRDSPWDFTILDEDNNETFHVEITSVADNSWSFEKLKREETYSKFIGKQKVRLRDLKKIYVWFRENIIKNILEKYEAESFKDDDIVDNPLFGEKKRLFISDSKDEESTLYDCIIKAIDKKVAKNHSDKEKTILIVDNRTIKFQLKDYFEAIKLLKHSAKKYPFKEIFLYNGYYSGLDGNNAEFSFSEIQLSKETEGVLRKNIESGQFKLGENDVLYY